MASISLSVAMATYNGERFIREQLSSLAAQTRIPDELVVTDDGSSDRTLEILAEFSRAAPFPVRVHRNERKLGFSDNFLKAASLCDGDWIAFCDQDDLWLPNKLATVEWHIRVNHSRDVLLVVHSAEVVDEFLVSSGILHPNVRRYRILRGSQLPSLWSASGFSMVFSSELVSGLSAQGRGPDPGVPSVSLAHDVWICRLARILGRITMLPERLVLYRRHEATTTGFLRGGNHMIKESRTIFGHIQNAKENGGEVYALHAESARHLAKVFGHLGLEERRNDWRERLLHAETHYADLAGWLTARSELYREPGFWRRVRRLWQLLFGGGYVIFNGRVRSLLGLRAFVKDVFLDTVVTFTGTH